MNPLQYTLTADMTATLILVKNQPMLSIKAADGNVITIYPMLSDLQFFRLVKDHADMLEWLEAESVVYALDKLERQFVNAYKPFSIITAPLLFETFKPQSGKLLDEKKPVSRRAS